MFSSVALIVLNLKLQSCPVHSVSVPLLCLPSRQDRLAVLSPKSTT